MKQINIWSLMAFILLSACEKKGGAIIIPSSPSTSQAMTASTDTPVETSASKSGAFVESSFELSRKNSDISSINFASDANLFVVKGVVKNPVKNNEYSIQCFDVTTQNAPVDLPSYSSSSPLNNDIVVSAVINVNSKNGQVSTLNVKCDVLENSTKNVPFKIDQSNLVVKMDWVIDQEVEYKKLGLMALSNTNFINLDAVIFKRTGKLFIEDNAININANYFYSEKDAVIQTFKKNQTNIYKMFQDLDDLKAMYPHKISELKDIELNHGRNGGKMKFKAKNVFGDLQLILYGENGDAPLFRQMSVPSLILPLPSNRPNKSGEVLIYHPFVKAGASGKNGGHSGQFILSTEQANANEVMNIVTLIYPGKGSKKALPKGRNGSNAIVQCDCTFEVVGKLMMHRSTKTIYYNEKDIKDDKMSYNFERALRVWNVQVSYEVVPYQFTEEELNVYDGVDGLTERSYLIINNTYFKL